MRQVRKPFALAALLLVVGACSSSETPAPTEPASPTTTRAAANPDLTPIEELDPAHTYVAAFDQSVPRYPRRDSAEPSGTLDPVGTVGGSAGYVVAAPYDRFTSRYEVHLGDGATAWVDAGRVSVERTNVVLIGKDTGVDSSGAGGGAVDVFDAPGAAEPAATITNPTSAEGLNVAPVVFLAHGPYDPTAEFVDVQLPVRPNGSTGYVRAADVDVATNRFRIEVALGAHEIRVFDGDEVVLEGPIGVGTDNTPTPGGVFYIRSLLASTDPLYGTYTFGLSGFSDVHQAFNGGPGDIGIHGTNDPATIGTDVSNGCIRLHDDMVVRLAHVLPEAAPTQSDDPRLTTGLGVPVEVLA